MTINSTSLMVIPNWRPSVARVYIYPLDDIKKATTKLNIQGTIRLPVEVFLQNQITESLLNFCFDARKQMVNIPFHRFIKFDTITINSPITTNETISKTIREYKRKRTHSTIPITYEYYDVSESIIPFIIELHKQGKLPNYNWIGIISLLKEIFEKIQNSNCTFDEYIDNWVERIYNDINENGLNSIGRYKAIIPSRVK